MTQTLPSTTIPPLESGDHLSRSEFERRYHAMPHIKKAELIEGVVFMASPLRFRPHAEPHGQLMTWLGTYAAFTPGVRMGDNPTVRLDLDNEPQPDAVLLIDGTLGGQSSLSEDGYIEGAPELVAEVAASSVSNDLFDKKRAYRRNGVQEYIVWQVLDQKLTWFKLIEDEYIEQAPDENGILCSTIFPGLWLNVNALLQDEMTQVLSVLQQGIQSPEHERFTKTLQ
ncbi:MAG: Uma2 family endonuclease [Synechococcaceae cyanobacterium SM2_3_2]|nr:Uma2 family endonuclease [Synechococcaceae cyanobacterium SM2_3_2]